MAKKLNKQQQLFADIQFKLTEEIYNKYDKIVNEIAKIQKVNKNAILDKIARIILENQVTEDNIDISTGSRIRLRKQLNKLIKGTFKGEYEAENSIVMENLYNVANDKYYSNCYLYSIGINYTLKPVKENTLKKIINKKIAGKNYSERIWTNKNKVAKQLRKEVNDFLNGKTTINEINSVIGKRFDVNWNNTNRLVRDSIGRVQWEANRIWRQEHNIKKVLWNATLDRRTCDDCQAYDGKVFDANDTPNQHVMCRCELISIVDGWEPKERLDNETKKRINYITYKEWKEQQDI